MSNITCTRRIQFCAGHRVLGHESKCSNAHGHNYVALFTASANNLDDLNRVIDFSVLKHVLGGWIDANWDHGFILNAVDHEMLQALQAIQGAKGPQKLYTVHGNPTAEFMAEYLLNDISPRLLAGSGITITKVQLWETENCYATATLKE